MDHTDAKLQRCFVFRANFVQQISTKLTTTAAL